MIEVEIPNDIRKYESKTIGPLTTRQLICCLIAGALDVAAYFIMTGPLGMSMGPNMVYAFAVVSIIPLSFCLKFYGMTAEKFLLHVVVRTMLSPKRRLYKTENTFGKAKMERTPKERAVAIRKLRETKRKAAATGDLQHTPFF